MLQLQHEAELRASFGDMAEEFIQDARNAPSVGPDHEVTSPSYTLLPCVKVDGKGTTASGRSEPPSA